MYNATKRRNVIILLIGLVLLMITMLKLLYNSQQIAEATKKVIFSHVPEQKRPEKKKVYSFDRKIYNKNDPKAHYEVMTYKYRQSARKSTEYVDNGILVLSSVTDENSYGGANVRTFKSLFNMINKLDVPKNISTMGIAVKSAEELGKIRKVVEEYYESDNLFDFFQEAEQFDFKYLQKINFKNVTENSTEIYEKIYKEKIDKIVLVHAPFIEDSFKVSRADRHSSAVQKIRRSIIAKSRNFLINNVHTDEQYTLFIDSDVMEIPRVLPSRFAQSGNDIVVARVQLGGNTGEYDRNTWIGQRAIPTNEEFDKLNKNKKIHDEKPPDKEEFLYVPHGKSVKFLDQLSNGVAKNSEEAFKHYVPVDSVGGAVLFVKSIIFKQGIQFPSIYIVGTDWQRLEGYDGIETEGLCYQARVIGYKCWGTPDVIAVHYL